MITTKEVILAENAGFCFGVSRAVNKAFEMSSQNKKIFTLGELIHNGDVVRKLNDSNVFTIEEKEISNLKSDDTILIRSHGITKDVMDRLNEKSSNVINLTCPYVTNIQQKVREFHDRGYSIIILGDKKHPEVIGINGWCDNSALISNKGIIDFEIPQKVCIVSQTTEKQENWVKLVSQVSEKAKEIVAFNTICKATELRQASTDKLSKEVEAMIVIGGKNSSNTTKLHEICLKNNPNTYFVENAKDLEKYLEELKKFSKIGITAGASTPQWIIEEALKLL